MWPEYTINLRIAGEGDVTVEKRTKAFFSFASGRGLSTMPLKGRVSENIFCSMVPLTQSGNVIDRKFVRSYRAQPRMNALASLDLYAGLLIP